jgi:hypothetical protein
VLTLFVYFQKLERYVGFDPAQWRPQLRQWQRILNVGLPAGGEFALIFAWMAVIYYVLRDFGAAAQAGFGIGTRVLGLSRCRHWLSHSPLAPSPARISARGTVRACGRPSSRRF